MRINTVFNSIDRTVMHPNEVLAVYFHRSAASIYMIYALWGILSIGFSVQTIEEAIGAAPQIVFAALVILITTPACIGAMFFPRTGRLELFSASPLAMLLAVYIGISIIDMIDGGEWNHLPSVVLLISTLVIPIARAVFIYKTLTKQADGGKPWRS